jgi:urease accessory protein
MIPSSAAPIPPSSGEGDTTGWCASLELSLELRHERTVISSRKHQGPLMVQRPFYPEDSGACHVVIVHPPGGIVGGDTLELSVNVARGGHGLLTTPAATKLYRSRGPTARVRQILKAEAGAILEWLPQETIAFNGSISSLTTRVELEPGASFIGWEVLCLGRPAAGELFERGELHQNLAVYCADRPLLIERLGLVGSGPELTEVWGLSGSTTLATLIAVGAETDSAATLVERVRAEVHEATGLFAVTQVSGTLVCRFLGHGGATAHRVLGRVWELIRPELIGRAVVRPRIWAT